MLDIHLVKEEYLIEEKMGRMSYNITYSNGNVEQYLHDVGLYINSTNVRIISDLDSSTLNALNKFGVIGIENSNVYMEKLIITKGYSPDKIEEKYDSGGAGLLILSGKMTMKNCTITLNKADVSNTFSYTCKTSFFAHLCFI